MRFGAIMAALLIGSATFVSAQKTSLKVGEIDPHGQCAWLSRDQPELEPVEKACEAAVAGSETLPNFVCDLKMTRTQPIHIVFRGGGSVRDSEQKDVFTAELRFIDGEEQLSQITQNGKPTENQSEIEGLSTKGEFSPPGLTVLDGRSRPAFEFRGEQKIGATPVLVFEYSVAKGSNVSWTWNFTQFQYHPGFHGSLWIDKENGSVRHLSLESDDVDAYVPTRRVVVTTEYGPVTIAGLGSYVLPLRSEAKTCLRRESSCSRIVREFTGCRKFAAKARIIE